jgi:glycosyltransferase involved in cell wall biosynthesis
LPGYKCGPIRTISNLVETFGDVFDFRIVTSDCDATDATPYPDVATDGTWSVVANAKVLYLSSAQKSLRHIGKILRETPHDALYLNSFFDPDFTQKPLLVRRLGLAPKARCIIAPRGEFAPGALQLKVWKKRPFLLASGMSGLYRGLTWQASNELEQADIWRVVGGSALDVCIAPNLPAAGERNAVHRPRAAHEPLRVCFLSRIAPKKNLNFALEVLRRVSGPVRFDIYGPVEDENYWSRCRVIMSRLPGLIDATYKGSVEHAAVSSVLAGYDLFFLPTLGENYGHVIQEALSAGTPVLIADTTPWRDLANAGIGWELSLDRPEAFVEKIDHMALMSSVELAQMRARAHSVAECRRTDKAIVDANRRLFAQAAAPE